jgi:DNA-directed RNA polymerase specialized sigma24 family protein
MLSNTGDDDEERFEHLLAVEGLRVRRALRARFGAELGTEAWADVVAWAWEHRDEVVSMTNPAGYLFRVGQSAVKVYTRWWRPVPLILSEPTHDASVSFDADLFDGLSHLNPNQRVAVLMVHGYGASYAEVADLLNISVAAVTNHVHRGLNRLRKQLEDDT